MKRYILRRILWGLLSAAATVCIVMAVLYGALDRNLIFASDTVYAKLSGDQKIQYKYEAWDKYGYIDLVHYEDFRNTADEGTDTSEDSFAQLYSSKGYEIVELGDQDDKEEGTTLFAWKDRNIARIILAFFQNLIEVDTKNSVEDYDGERGLTFTLHDPAYGGDVFAPALMGSGTKHRYLLYFDDAFPFIHQNVIKLNLGLSFSVNQGIDIVDTMTRSQGSPVYRDTIYPSGYTELSADDLHTAVYLKNSRETLERYLKLYEDDYTSVSTRRSSMSKVGFSFFIGIIAVLISYLLALPISAYMAMRSGKMADLLGTAYIAIITAVPSLAYIFLFKAAGKAAGLPVTFRVDDPSWKMYVLPIVSLALPQIANLMKWNRRFAVDQMGSDYILFAKACGFGEWDVLKKKLLKNAVIPILHGLPWSILSAVTGAIITERVYSVPGAGNLLTDAINRYDNGVIVGLTFFYAILSVASVIAGDLLMAAVDPRIDLADAGKGGL